MVEREPSKLETRVRFPSPAFLGLLNNWVFHWPLCRIEPGLSSRGTAGVAQLVEHVLGKDEVRSSILLSSLFSESLRGRTKMDCRRVLIVRMF